MVVFVLPSNQINDSFVAIVFQQLGLAELDLLLDGLFTDVTREVDALVLTCWDDYWVNNRLVGELWELRQELTCRCELDGTAKLCNGALAIAQLNRVFVRPSCLVDERFRPINPELVS